MLCARAKAFLSVLIFQNSLGRGGLKAVMRASPIRHIFLRRVIRLQSTFLTNQDGQASQSEGRKKSQKYNLMHQ